MLVNGVVVLNSDFNSLFQSIVTSYTDLKQTGVDSLINAFN